MIYIENCAVRHKGAYFLYCICYLALLYSFYHTISARRKGLCLVFGFAPLHQHCVLSVIDLHSYLLNKRIFLYKCPTINIKKILKDFKVGLLRIKQERFLKDETSKERIFTGRFQGGCPLSTSNGMNRGCFTTY